MKNTYAREKKLRSLSNRYLSEYNAHLGTVDLNAHYLIDLQLFVEDLLTKECGYEFNKKPEVHRGSHSGERPKQRNPGERPKQTGEAIDGPTSGDLAKPLEESDIPLPVNSSSMPIWKKRLWKKIMMEVHPDRIGLVAVDEKDKVLRVKIREDLQAEDCDAMLISAARFLSIDPGISAFEQERKLRVAIYELKNKIAAIQRDAPWVWGESFTNNNTRLDLIKAILKSNSTPSISDEIILKYISRIS